MHIEAPQIRFEMPVLQDQVTIVWDGKPGLSYIVVARGAWDGQTHAEFVEINSPGNSYTFENCIPGSLIKVYVQADDGFNRSLASNLLSIETAPAVQSIAIKSCKSMLVNEELVSDITLNIVAASNATKGELFCNGAPTKSLTKQHQIAYNEFEYTHRVVPGQTYSYTVALSSQEYNVSHQATTEVYLPFYSGLKNIFSSQITENSCLIEWEQLQLSQQISYDIFLNGNLHNSTVNSACAIDGLKPDTSYNIHVVAKNGVHEFHYNPVVITTQIYAPRNLTSLANDNSITVSCLPVPGAEQYKFYINGQLAVLSPISNYTYTSLTPNTQYHLSCSALKDGYETPATSVFITTSIASPHNVQIQEVTCSSIILGWEAVSGATSYVVYWLNNDWEIVGVATDTVFTYDKLKPDTEYIFCVSALYGEHESGKSEECRATTLLPPPANPKNLIATNVLAQTITLAWDAIYYFGQDVRYKVYANDNLIDETNAPVYTIANLRGYQTYTFFVTAESNGIESMPSNVFSIVTAPQLKAPVGLDVVIVGQTLQIAWEAVNGATEYFVFINGTKNICTTTFFEYTSTITGAEYVVSVQAANENGTSYQSVPVNVAMPAVSTTMSKDVVVQAGSYGFSVAWQTVPKAYSYKITIGTEIFETTDAFINVANKQPNTMYSVMIVASTPDGNLAPLTVSIRTKFPPPEHFNALLVGVDQVSLGWSLVADAISYKIVSVEQTIVGNIIMSETENVVATSANDACSITSLLANTAYNFAIYSVGENGMLSDRSGLLTITTGINAAAIPTNLSASLVETTSFQARWNKAEDATAYNVYIDQELINTVTAPLCFADIVDLIPGTAYNVQITSIYDNVESELSEALEVVTKPAEPASVTISQTGGNVELAWTSVVGATTYRLYYKTNYHDYNYLGMGLSIGEPGLNQNSPVAITSANYFKKTQSQLAVYLHDFNLNMPYWFGISAINKNGIESSITKYPHNFTWANPSITNITDLNQQPIITHGVNQAFGSVVIKWHTTKGD